MCVGADIADYEYIKEVCNDDSIEFIQTNYSLNELIEIRDKVVYASEVMREGSTTLSATDNTSTDLAVNATSIASYLGWSAAVT